MEPNRYRSSMSGGEKSAETIIDQIDEKADLLFQNTSLKVLKF